MFAGVDGQVAPRHMDENFGLSLPLSRSSLATLKRLLSGDDNADFSVFTTMLQSLEGRPWLGVRAAAQTNSSLYRRELAAAHVSLALSHLRHNNFELGYLAALDAAHHALDDGQESDWAHSGDAGTDAILRNGPSDVQLSGSAAAVAAAASAAGTACASVRSNHNAVVSLTTAAKHILCPDAAFNSASQFAAAEAHDAVMDCDGIQASVFRVLQMIFNARDHKQGCTAAFAVSSLVRQVTLIPHPLYPKRPIVALLACATAGYKQFIAPMTASARKHFLASCCDLKFVIFTDNEQHQALQADDIIALPRNHGGWPAASLGRTASYLAHSQQYAWADYVFATDVDVKFTRAIGAEILGRTVGTLHADNAFYRGDERTGHSTVDRLGCLLFFNANSQQVATATHESVAGMMWRQHGGGEAVLTRAVYEPRAQR